MTLSMRVLPLSIAEPITYSKKREVDFIKKKKEKKKERCWKLYESWEQYKHWTASRTRQEDFYQVCRKSLKLILSLKNSYSAIIVVTTASFTNIATVSIILRMY